MKLDTKNIYLPFASSDDKNMEEQEPTEMTIKTNESACDYRSCSTMSVSLDVYRIPRKKDKKETIRNFNHRE